MVCIKYKSDIVVGAIVVTPRDCKCSGDFIPKDTIGVIVNIKGSMEDGFDFRHKRGITDVCIAYCGDNPRFRLAYKNEEKLYESG